IDLAGARQVRETLPEARFVFLAPPDWDTLVDRLVGRGTEDAEERARRLATARVELAAEDEFDVTIVNDTVDRAAAALSRLLGVPDLTCGPPPPPSPPPEEGRILERRTSYLTKGHTWPEQSHIPKASRTPRSTVCSRPSTRSTPWCCTPPSAPARS